MLGTNITAYVQVLPPIFYFDLHLGSFLVHDIWVASSFITFLHVLDLIFWPQETNKCFPDP